ncbi:MAG: helix-turn-helix transcriptional regulator [Bacteroidota bacterium]
MGAKLLMVSQNKLVNEALRLVLSEEAYRVEIYQGNIIDLDQVISYEEPDMLLFCENSVRNFGKTISEFISAYQDEIKFAYLLYAASAGLMLDALKQGAHGFVDVQEGLDELLNCLEAVDNNKTYISPTLAGSVNTVKQPVYQDAHSVLTPRELEIIKMVRQNKTSKQIGKVLNLSYKTIQNHRYSICKKLGLTGRNKLYEYAVEHF